MRADLLVGIQSLADLDACQKAVLVALAIRANGKSGQCNPSLKTLQGDTGWGRSAVSSALKELRRRGLIEIRKAYRNANSYAFGPDIERLSSPLRGPLTLPDCDESSPPRGRQWSATRTSVVRHTDASSPPGGPKVVSEVVSEISSEVSGGRQKRSQQQGPDMAQTVDRILALPGANEWSDRELARQTFRTLGNGGEPSEAFVRGVGKCREARRRWAQA